MRALIQRVRSASVQIDHKYVSNIGEGLLVLIGIENDDLEADMEWLSKKIVQLRIFSDPDGLMNLSVLDINGEILVVSQFTLHANVKKGNRPSFIRAAKPEIAIPRYERFKTLLAQKLGKSVSDGEFGANMLVSLENNGPVTIFIDSKNKE
jgi:D-tyrosyl-tRNA(Tyr) deacylase